MRRGKRTNTEEDGQDQEDGSHDPTSGERKDTHAEAMAMTVAPAKTKSNFLGTRFSIREPCGTEASSEWRIGSVRYELNVAGLAGPRKMKAIVPIGGHSAVSSSSVDMDASTSRASSSTSSSSSSSSMRSTTTSATSSTVSGTTTVALRSKSPTWHEELRCWCLDFNGRVTEASVKNFQLVEDREQMHDDDEEDAVGGDDSVRGGSRATTDATGNEDVVMQFGKMQENPSTSHLSKIINS